MMTLKKMMQVMFETPEDQTKINVSVVELTRRLAELTEENDKLKKFYVKSHGDITVLQSIIKTIAQNQAQLAADMHTVYTAVRDSGIMDADYSEPNSEVNKLTNTDEDDDTGSGGGMGGMLN